MSPTPSPASNRSQPPVFHARIGREFFLKGVLGTSPGQKMFVTP
jgi:hypothetical protein